MIRSTSSPRRLRLIFVVFLAALGATAGCASRHAPRVAPLADGSSDALRATAKGRARIGAERIRFEAALASKGRDRIYVELSGPVGGTRAVLIAREDRLLVLFPPDREFIETRPTPSAYEAILGLPVDTAGLIDLIGGAGGTDTKRMPVGSGDVAGVIVVAYEGVRIGARVEHPREGGLIDLELRITDLERPDPGAIPDDLFDAVAPAEWTRVTIESRASGSPVLYP